MDYFRCGCQSTLYTALKNAPNFFSVYFSIFFIKKTISLMFFDKNVLLLKFAKLGVFAINSTYF